MALLLYCATPFSSSSSSSSRPNRCMHIRSHQYAHNNTVDAPSSLVIRCLLFDDAFPLCTCTHLWQLQTNIAQAYGRIGDVVAVETLLAGGKGYEMELVQKQAQPFLPNDIFIRCFAYTCTSIGCITCVTPGPLLSTASLAAPHTCYAPYGLTPPIPCSDCRCIMPSSQHTGQMTTCRRPLPSSKGCGAFPLDAMASPRGGRGRGRRGAQLLAVGLKLPTRT